MNRERVQSWLIRAAVLIVLGGFVVWIASNTYWDTVTLPTRLKGEALTDPQYAIRKFLESLPVRVESHQSFTSLPPTNTVLVVNYWHWDLIDSRRQKIEDWLRAGGRLVLDTTVIGVFTALGDVSGIERQLPKPTKDKSRKDEEDDEEKCEVWNVAIDSRGISNGAEHYSLCNVTVAGWLVSQKRPLWALRDKAGYQAVRVPFGEGDITVINASLFDNVNFRGTERAKLLVAATQLRGGDEVWLLTEARHPSILTLVWRYGAPVVIFFGLYVLATCWRSAARFGPLRAPEDAVRRSLAEQIRGTGWFILRLGGARTLYAAMLRALKEAAERRIARFGKLTPEQQIDALVKHTGVDRDALLQAFYTAEPENPMRKSRQQLYRAIATFETARRVLLHDRSTIPAQPSAAHSERDEATHAN